MSAPRTAGLALVAALMMNGQAHPAPAPDPVLTYIAMTRQSLPACLARFTIRAREECARRSDDAARRIANRLGAEPALTLQLYLCMAWLEQGRIVATRGATAAEKVAACFDPAPRGADPVARSHLFAK